MRSDGQRGLWRKRIACVKSLYNVFVFNKKPQNKYFNNNETDDEF